MQLNAMARLLHHSDQRGEEINEGFKVVVFKVEELLSVIHCTV